jgi:hypothetical protein
MFGFRGSVAALPFFVGGRSGYTGSVGTGNIFFIVLLFVL